MSEKSARKAINPGDLPTSPFMFHVICIAHPAAKEERLFAGFTIVNLLDVASLRLSSIEAADSFLKSKEW